MAKSRAPDLAAQLLAAPFGRETPAVQTASDPLVDTPMRVTLEQVRPYQLNPRRVPNPQYEAIKASIRQRGLDQPPSITRRPGEEHFIIRNGGNTRLAILNELWTETADERFHTLLCLFRPWTARGEILALTGHLAENELRGSLSYIERSQAVEQARQLYEQESGQPLNQRELAERLTADGYPVDQPAISRMGDTVAYLLPAIPYALHAGLGRPQVSKLLLLRKAAQRTWQQHAPGAEAEFTPIFEQSLARCDGEMAAFSVDRARDELIGDLAQRLELGYDELALDLGQTELRRGMLSQLLEPEVPLPRPAPGKLPAADAFTAPPTQAAAPNIDELRQRIAELAQAISTACAPTIEVLAQNEGLGFACRCADQSALPAQGQALLGLWQALADPTSGSAANIGALLCGTPTQAPWLDDETLARLFRLIKLARQLPHSGEC
ncbi:ParB family protein [Pseudomonas sp. R4-34-07]|uniref:ParB family protein n=1 Tax=Pseudomonas sp. R4-34-07 TaxID=658642 RepID=UPI000F5710AA|nr:ParB family protein [Pseudomonas sp. R4-34-07]